MASHLVSKRITAAVPKLRRSLLASPHRCVATAAQQQMAAAPSQGDQPRRRREVTPFLPLGIFDLWDPVSSNRSMRQMLDTVDRFVDAPTSFGGVPSGVRTPWDILEKPDAFYMRVDMPGLDKSEVNISVEDEELVIRGEHKVREGHEDIFGDRKRNYSTRMILPKEVDASGIKAELKNGVLTVVVPKMKPPEKKVTQVQIS